MPGTNERFVSNPVSLDISRSKFNLNHKVTMTFDPGLLVPILAYSDVLPGDTFKLDLSFVCRSTTPIAPTMDDAYIQVEFYFVPHKLVLSRAYMSPQLDDSNRSFEAMIGAQDSLLNMPLPDDDINLPSVNWDASDSSIIGLYKKSIGHYLGYPLIAVGYDASDLPQDLEFRPNALPLLAYYAVWNENYREPNLWSPVVFSVTAGGVVTFASNEKAGIDSSSGNIYKDTLAHVCREHGYFGSALPWPQRNGSTVTIPLGTLAPVVTGDDQDFTGMSGATPMHWADTTYAQSVTGHVIGSSTGSNQPTVAKMLNDTITGSANDGILPSNLWANLEDAAAASVNVFRYAIQLQRLYEAWARGGNRIQDMTQIFGVTPHDMGDDRPEYLGGKRIPLNITQVNNTAGTTYSTSTQQSIGSTGAFSNTSDSDHYFTKSFDTWGTLLGVCLVRHHDSIPNGYSKMLQRRNRLDFYWPQFANLGEQPVYLRELALSSGAANSGANYLVTNNILYSRIFGYQEAYAEYRYLPDRTVGEVNSEFGSIKYWTYGIDFDSLIQTYGIDLDLSNDINLSFFLDASYQKLEFDQTLQVSSDTAGFTFLAQFYFDITAIRPMPLYSIPGLMDHH